MSRRTPVRVLGLLLCVAVAFSGFVANADAKRMSKAKKQAVTKKLRSAVKKNPKVISKRWFLKQASQVNFTLPSTIRLLPAKDHDGNRIPNVQTTTTAPNTAGDTSITVADTAGLAAGQVIFIGIATADNEGRAIASIAGSTINLNAPLVNNHISGVTVSTLPNGANYASLDLGPSLGSRTIGLGGYIRADINFNDAFDGGNLGDVNLKLLPGGDLRTTSVGLLANPNVTDETAPENEIDAVIPITGSAFNLTFDGVNIAAIAPGWTTASISNTLETALAALPNPVTNVGTIGAESVYVWAAASGPATKITIVFGSSKFNGANMPALNDTGAPNPTLINPLTGTPPGNSFTLVNGDNGSLDLEGNGGCASFDGNGQGPIHSLPTPGGDVDVLGNINSSLTPGLNDNLGVGPSYGGSTDPKDTVLRTGPLSVQIATPKATSDWAVGDGIPADSSDFGVGGNNGLSQPNIGASNGKANLFGNPVNGLASGHSVDTTVNLSTDINSIEREVDGAFPAPAGNQAVSGEKLGNVNAYANCRQAWTGALKNYLTNIHLVGSLKISPAITADGKLRIARVALKSQRPAPQALAACLSPYQLYLRGNPTTGDAPYSNPPNPIGPNIYAVGGAFGSDVNGFNPLAVLAGSQFGAATNVPPFGGVPSASAPATGVKCDSGAGPLDRSPFDVKPLAGTSGSPTAPSLSSMLVAGAAVAVRGELDVKNLNAEVLVGNVVGG